MRARPPSNSAPPNAAAASRLTDAAAVGAAVALLAAALLPAVVGFATTIYFDMDPRGVPGGLAVTQFGPAGLAWLQAGAVAAAGLALGVHAAAGGRVHPLALVLLAGGAAAAGVHLGGGAAHRVTVGGWVAGACVGVAVMHLGQHRAARRVMAAALVALILPLVLDAAWYVWVGHPMTVESFRDNEQAFLAARGWEPGSPQHELYVRRLLADDAVGAFGLSNVLGTLAAGLTVLAAAVGLGVWLGRREEPSAGAGAAERAGAGVLPLVLGGVGAVMGAYLVWMTRSRGAVVALGIGAALLAGLAIGRRVRWLPRAAGGAGLACVALAVVAVVLRGAMGAPETEAGERSLLFRYHYAQAAAAALAEAGPGGWVTGIGPGGFETAYLRLKDPINPEEVQSAHSASVDYVVMLGSGGACWLGLLAWWLWRGGVAAGRALEAGDDAGRGAEERPEAGTAGGAGRVWLVPAGALGVVLFGTQYAVELPEMVIETALLWLVGALGFVGVMAALSRRGAADRRWTTAGVFVAAAVVLTQSQIEMGFYQPSSAGLMWLIVGLAGAGRPTDQRGTQPGAQEPGRRWLAWGGAAAVLAGGAVLAGVHAGPITAHQSAMREAAALLRAGQGSAALEQLDAAQRVLPADELTARWRASLRLQAAAELLAADRRDLAERFAAEAAEAIRSAQTAGAGAPVLDRLWVRVWELRAQLAETESAAERARDETLAAQRRVLAKAPYSVSDHVRLGDMLWDRGERAAAAEAYRAALRVSELRYLDPATQLGAATARRLRERVERVTDEPGG